MIAMTISEQWDCGLILFLFTCLEFLKWINDNIVSPLLQDYFCKKKTKNRTMNKYNLE